MSTSLTVPQRAGRVVVSDLDIKTLGPCRHPSPLAPRLGKAAFHYVGKADRVLLDDRLSRFAEPSLELSRIPAFELAGPRDHILFEPGKLRCGVVTCGGLCPGINNVIRGLVLELTEGYGVADVIGFRYGYEGLVGGRGHEPVELTASVVADIHHEGGTTLGTSRGDQDPREMVDRLEKLDVGVLFVVGGDGTLRGAMKLVGEIVRRDRLISVIGIPKTIDNDIHFIDKSFIRSVPASPTDSLYCWNMARNAVHAAMAGNTEMLIGRWHGRFVHVPMALATRYRKQVDTAGDLWMSVVESTGQPMSWAT